MLKELKLYLLGIVLIVLLCLIFVYVTLSFTGQVWVDIGGKYVEILKDITFRACPITKEDAEQMIDELKFKQILFGARNEKLVDKNILVKTLVTLSQLPEKNKKIEELDINPFIISEKQGKVADARIVFS